MGYGFETYDENGHLQFNSEMATYFLRKTGTCSSIYGQADAASGKSNYMHVPGATTYPGALVGFSGGNGGAVAFSLNGAYASNDFWEYITDAPSTETFNYFIFDKSANLPASDYGLEVFDAYGNRTFSALFRPMRSRSIGGDYYSASGVQLGFIPLAYGGHNFYSDGEEPGSYYHDWSVYGAGNGSVLYAPETDVVAPRTIEVPGGVGTVFGTRPSDANQHDIPSNFLIFETAGIPIDDTFF
jgi:hypothetical protein